MEWKSSLRLVLLILFSLLLSCQSGDGGGKPAKTGRLPAPDNFTLVPGLNKVTLHWTPVDGALSYRLYWSTNVGLTVDNGTIIENAQPGYLHADLVNGQNYYYIVVADNADGEGLPSNVATTIPVGVPIVGLLPDINLQFCIESLALTNGWVYADSVTGVMDCRFRGITNLSGLQHFSSVRELILADNLISDLSPVSSLYGLVSLDLSNNQIKSPIQLDINQLTLFSKIQSLKLAGNMGIACSDMTAMKLALGGILSDVTTAVSGQNCSTGATKPVDNGQALQAWPTQVVAISGDSKITLHWRAALNATSYNLYWSTTPGVTVATGTVVSDVQSGYVDSGGSQSTGLTNGTTYYYIVTAVASGVESQASVEVSTVPSNQGVLLNGLFVDANLQSCIDSVASVKGWTFAREIYGTLDCSSRTIADLSGIDKLGSLLNLNLLNNNIVDISPLSQLVNLSRLIINDNQIQDVSSLSVLSKLVFLNIRNNQITDVSAIGNLFDMVQLYADSNTIVDASPLASLTAIDILDLRNNAIGGLAVGNVDSLVSLTQASSIRLTGNANIACEELVSLVQVLGQNVVDIASTIGTSACSIIPGAPINVTAGGGNQRIVLQWDGVLGANDYNIYWSLTPGVDVSTATKINSVLTRFTHAGLLNAATYYYVVTAANLSGESNPSAEVSTTPSQTPIVGLFVDSELQYCIDELALLKDWVNADDITGTVNCSLLGIHDLSGIEHLTQVTALLLNENNIQDITPISFLPNLKILSLRKNNISDVKTLNQMTGLTELILNDNRIINVRSLSRLTSLLKLDLSNNLIGRRGVGFVDSLAVLINLNELHLAGNPEIDCGSLTQLKNVLNAGLVDIDVVTDGENCRIPSLIPKQLQAVSGDTHVTLMWRGVNQASQYNLYWSTTPNVDSTTGNLLEVSGEKYLHTGLINQTNYYYVISAVVGTSEGPVSNQIQAIPSANGTGLVGVFPDTNLTSCVNGVAGQNTWTLTHEVVGELSCSSKAIDDITGIQFLSNVETIRFGGNNIQDISALSGLTNLSFLDLFKNAIVDISSLSTLSSLTRLYLHDNQISNIAPLSSLSLLNYLILDGNSVTNLAPLASNLSLIRLFIRNNGVSDVSPLSTLSNLTELYINGNNIADVSSLSNLTVLQKLDLRDNAIGGQGVGKVDSLVTLSNVTQIWLSGNLAMSCGELETLILALGPAAIDLGSAISGVNCTLP